MNNKVNIIITHRCNLLCKHCYMNAGNNIKENEEEILNRFNKLLQFLKNNNINEVMLTGGECSISPNFPKIIKLCENNNIKVGIFTNGMISTSQYDYIDNYCLSLDGEKEFHNYLRGNELSYDRLIDNIKKLIEKNKKLSLQMTISKDNMLSIPNVAETITELGIKNLNLCCLLDEGRCIENNINTNLNLNNLKKIIYKTLDKTGYNLKIHTNIFNKYSINFLFNNSINFPLWIDLVNNTFYLIKDNSIFSKNLKELSSKNIELLYNKLHKFIEKNKKIFIKKEEFVLENELIKLLYESGGIYE